MTTALTRTDAAVPTPATFVAPPGGLPSWEVYEAIESSRRRSRYQAQHVGELAGKYVAWSFDGSLVLAADTPDELHAVLANAGVGRDEYIAGYVDPEPDVVVPRSTPLSRA